jgi:simple sugar transport system permease protein
MVLAANTVALSAPLILAAVGGYFSERGGVVNIALEGKMLVAACVTALATVAFNNGFIGLACGIASSLALSFVHWLMTQSFRTDAVVSGMAINVIALGATNFLDEKYVDPDRSLRAPFLPLNAYYAFAFVVPLIAWAYARWTRGGLRLQAAGSDPDKARQMGVNPALVRLRGLAFSGLLCGVAGAAIVSNAGQFVQEMTAGRGFIALAALILGGWRPIPAALACVGFGFCSALEIVWQGSVVFGARIPPEAWTALPYFVTILALAGFAAKTRSPAGMGKL